MPRYSCFTRYGLLRFSSQPSDAEKIYRALINAYTDPVTGKTVFDLSKGTHLEAKIYATSMALGAARSVVERANNQNNPVRSYDSIEAWEAAFGLVPNPSDDLTTRRLNVAARALLPRGARREAMVDGLSKILGANFINYRPITTDELNTWPANPSLGPGVFSRPDLPTKTVRLLDPVTVTGSPTTISYENWNTNFPAQQIIAGDVLSVQSENLGQAEKVTVASADATTLTATFTKAHDAGASATTGPAPIWWSTKRIALIVVKHAAAVDPVTRKRVDEFMSRAARTITQWSIVEPTTPGATSIGPFTLDTSPLGAVTIGPLAVFPGPFDPATLPLDWWQRTDYPGQATTWPGTPSLGTSGSHSGFGTGLQGAPLTGGIPIDLTPSKAVGGDANLDSYITTSTASGAVLFMGTVATADAGGPSAYLNAQVMADGVNALIGVDFTVNGAGAWAYDGAWHRVQFACATGGWHLMQFYITGGTLSARLDSGGWSSVGLTAGFGGLALSLQTIAFGVVPYSGAGFTGQVREGFLAKAVLTHTDFDHYKSYVNTRYGLSL